MDVGVTLEDGGIAVLTMSSSNGINVFSRAALRVVCDALDTCDRDPQVRGVVVRAAGRVFSAGADLDEFPCDQDAYRYLEEMIALVSTPERIGKPVIAALNQPAYAAGFEFALACDWIVAAPAIELGVPEIRFGLMPGYCMGRLASLIGEARAKRLMLDPGPYRAAELAEFGIHVSEAGSHDSVDTEAVTLCRRMTVGSPNAVRAVKRITNRFARGNDFESVVHAYNFLFATEPVAERVKAFREGRP